MEMEKEDRAEDKKRSITSYMILGIRYIIISYYESKTA